LAFYQEKIAMKTLNLIPFLMSVTLSTVALAANVQTASFQEFRRDALKAQSDLGTDLQCSLAVTDTGEGLRLKITTDSTSAELFVPAEAKITHADLSSGGDGSDEKYKVHGKGTFEIINASDMFYAVEITTSEGAARCEIDF
jgi:hypothetical protein